MQMSGRTGSSQIGLDIKTCLKLLAKHLKFNSKRHTFLKNIF